MWCVPGRAECVECAKHFVRALLRDRVSFVLGRDGAVVRELFGEQCVVVRCGHHATFFGTNHMRRARSLTRTLQRASRPAGTFCFAFSTIAVSAPP